MILTCPSSEHFRHMQGDAYPTPTIAAWHLRQHLLQQSQNSSSCGIDRNAIRNQTTASSNHSQITESSCAPSNCQEGINQLIITAAHLATDLNPAQISYVWCSCESIYRQSADFVK